MCYAFSSNLSVLATTVQAITCFLVDYIKAFVLVMYFYRLVRLHGLCSEKSGSKYRKMLTQSRQFKKNLLTFLNTILLLFFHIFVSFLVLKCAS